MSYIHDITEDSDTSILQKKWTPLQEQSCGTKQGSNSLLGKAMSSRTVTKRKVLRINTTPRKFLCEDKSRKNSAIFNTTIN